MTVSTRVINVGVEAVRLDADSVFEGENRADQSLLPYNFGPATVFMGGPDVTPDNGLPLLSGMYGPPMQLGRDDACYGVCASGSAEVRVLELGTT